MRDIKSVVIIGSGELAGEWAARFLARGLKVRIWDPIDNLFDRVFVTLDDAWPSMSRLGLFPGAVRDNLSVVDDVDDLLGKADFVIECCTYEPTRVKELWTEIAGMVRDDIPVASCSSVGDPHRLSLRVIRPVYLMPCIEILSNDETDAALLDRGEKFFTSLGLKVLMSRGEESVIERISDVMKSEALRLTENDIAKPHDIDDAVVHGIGLLSSVLGPIERDRLDAADNRSGKISLRDNCLISIMQALRAHDHGAGRLLQDDESRRIAANQDFPTWNEGDEVASPLALYSATVLPEWVDYNGHMTEAAYLTAFGWASDALFRYIGDDEAYRASGLSFYTVETHINYFQECSSGDPLSFTTQLLGLDEKRMHIFHAMYHGHSGELLATTEQMLLHVDMKASRACPIRTDVYQALQAIMSIHSTMETPRQVGRQMAVRKR